MNSKDKKEKSRQFQDFLLRHWKNSEGNRFD